MSRVKLTNVSHQFEAEMVKELLKSIDVEVFISENNGPEKMAVYLGQNHEGVDLYVEEDRLEVSKELLEAQPETLETMGEAKEVKFPYWIIGGFAVMLIIFLAYNFM